MMKSLKFGKQKINGSHVGANHKIHLSHRYVMKLHRHTSHENDNSTTHK